MKWSKTTVLSYIISVLFHLIFNFCMFQVDKALKTAQHLYFLGVVVYKMLAY